MSSTVPTHAVSVASDYALNVDWTELRYTGVALRQVPEEFRRQTRAAIQRAGQDMLHEAMWRAAAFSQRIPHALKLEVRMGARATVALRASLQIAPHSRVMEGFVDDPFRHPVFGHYDRWVAQVAHPYLLPTAELVGGQFVQDIRAVLADVYARAGLT